MIFVSISCCDFRIVRDINSFDHCFIQEFYKGIVYFDNFEKGDYFFDIKYINKDEFEIKNGLNVVYDVVKDKYLSFSLYIDLNDNRTYYNFNNLKYDSTLDEKHYKAYIDDNDNLFELWSSSDKVLDNHEELPIYTIKIKSSLDIHINSHESNTDYRK